MNCYDHLETQLRDAAYQRRHRRMSRLVHPPRVFRRVPAVAVMVCCLVAVAVVAVAVLPSRSRTPEREATTSVATSPVPAAHMRALAVLRREQTARDRSPRAHQMLTALSPELVAGVRLDSIRVLRSSSDETLVLVSVERLRRSVDDGVENGLCLLSARGAESNAARTSCGDSSDLYAGRIGWQGMPRGLAPDGVARAVVSVRGGGDVEVPVRNNVYDTNDGAGEPAGMAIGRPVWLDQAGRIVQFNDWR